MSTEPVPVAAEPTEAEKLAAYFAKIPRWDAPSAKDRFEVMSDRISGRIPVTRLESWQEFTRLVEDAFFNKAGVHLVFRGHRRYDWGLTPTLGRLSKSGIVTRVLSDEQLAKFRRAIRGRIEDRALLEQDDPHQCDELWAVGQHHGLMTPLLDWTYSPYVALFFAFAEADPQAGEKENPYRVVYLLNKTFVDNDELCPEIRVLEPRKDDHGRLVNQAGLFTFSPYGETLENKLTNALADPDFAEETFRNADEEEQPSILAGYICKIYIKNEDRAGCLRHLRRMNVHHASLFPDLIGAAAFCNTVISAQAADGRYSSSDTVAAPLPDSAVQPVAPPAHEMVSALLLEQLAELLRTPQVEPARLGSLVEEVAGALSKREDESNETRAERLGRVLPVTLRRYAYPADLRDGVINQVLTLIKK